MKITLENTEQIVEYTVQSGSRDSLKSTRGLLGQARVWVGQTESGIPVQALIMRIAVANTERQAEFEQALREQPVPVPEPLAFPLHMRMVL